MFGNDQITEAYLLRAGKGGVSMGVYIKSMEMPKGCFFCPFNRHIDPDTDKCVLTRDAFDSTFRVVEHRRANCPLVPVPEHGDLIDRDYVKEHLYACETNGRPLHTLELCELLDAINDIPTIIPAEEGK